MRRDTIQPPYLIRYSAFDMGVYWFVIAVDKNILVNGLEIKKEKGWPFGQPCVYLHQAVSGLGRHLGRVVILGFGWLIALAARPIHQDAAQAGDDAEQQSEGLQWAEPYVGHMVGAQADEVGQG
jgi:hypothetical protein